MIDSDSIIERFAALSPHLDERERRLFAATEATSAGYGGIAAVARLTGIAPSTIGRGRRAILYFRDRILDVVIGPFRA